MRSPAMPFACRKQACLWRNLVNAASVQLRVTCLPQGLDMGPPVAYCRTRRFPFATRFPLGPSAPAGAKASQRPWIGRCERDKEKKQDQHVGEMWPRSKGVGGPQRWFAAPPINRSDNAARQMLPWLRLCTKWRKGCVALARRPVSPYGRWLLAPAWRPARSKRWRVARSSLPWRSWCAWLMP